MIYKFQNEKGIISYSQPMLLEMVTEAVKPWTYTGKLRLLSEGKDHKMFTTGPKGLLIDIHVQIAIGESITEFVSAVMGFIFIEVTESLEIPLDDIRIYIDGAFTQKGNTVNRDLVYTYSEIKNSKAATWTVFGHK